MIPINKTAWVSGNRLVGYTLHVAVKDFDANVFGDMHPKYFSDLRRAQDVANSIRAFVKLQRSRRSKAAAKKAGI